MLKTVRQDISVASENSTELAARPSGRSRLGRRSFLKRLGIGGTALVPAAGWLATSAQTRADGNGRLTRGDVAILRFLAAAEIIETDLWQQYTEIALGNLPFLQALQALDGDMPTYVNQNTRDERSHAGFINAYLMSKGHQPVSLEMFRRLPSSQATGSNKGANRLTNLMNLTVDTSWFNRYRFPGNPDFGDTFPQIVDLVNVPTIPNGDLPIGGDDIQVIANAAGFHFATIEQGGSSLYDSFLPKATSPEVIRIVAAIGGTEVMHFELWQDKAGNAPAVPGRFPQLPVAPNNASGMTFFPGDGTDPSQPNFTNQVMPAPCKFISTDLPLCSVIRPTLTANAGATAAATGLTNSGLFAGQDQEFFSTLFELAEEADEAQRGS
ncbi:MAG TPA: twin-arginine translocation signal domain-containing protein [Candidatus Binatia bacterium]|nr:twin-arginine translocation signal domain-containing protein [Candidatus Binatia bacterium]